MPSTAKITASTQAKVVMPVAYPSDGWRTPHPECVECAGIGFVEVLRFWPDGLIFPRLFVCRTCWAHQRRPWLPELDGPT